MENIKKYRIKNNFHLLEQNIDNILNDNVYHERDWNDTRLKCLYLNLTRIKMTLKKQLIDMDRLDPNFVSESEYKEKFSGFDDDTLSYMCKLENKKLEDARIPPLIVRNETIMLKNNLSREVYNGAEETTNSIAKCDSDCEGNTGRFETQEKEEEEE